MYAWNPLTISPHLAMFNDHCSRASGDIKYFNFLITSKNILIEVSSN